MRAEGLGVEWGGVRPSLFEAWSRSARLGVGSGLPSSGTVITSPHSAHREPRSEVKGEAGRIFSRSSPNRDGWSGARPSFFGTEGGGVGPGLPSGMVITSPHSAHREPRSEVKGEAGRIFPRSPPNDRNDLVPAAARSGHFVGVGSGLPSSGWSASGCGLEWGQAFLLRAGEWGHVFPFFGELWLSGRSG
jgi:hypothetical protein